MKLLVSWLCALVVVVGAPAVAHAGAEVIVTVTRSGGGICSGTSVYFFNAGTPFTLNLGSCDHQINIDTISSSINIGKITLDGGPSSGVIDIVLAPWPNSLIQSDTAPTYFIGANWAGIDDQPLDFSSAVRTRLYGGIGGAVTGEIHVDEISRFDCLGALQAPITCQTGINFGNTFVVQASSSTTGGTISVSSSGMLRVRGTGTQGLAGAISAQGGGINLIASTSGGLFGNVSATGDIASIDMGGAIGTSTTPVSITTTGHGSDVGTVKGTAVYANITTPHQSNPRGDTKRIEATTGGFKGSLTTYVMQGTALGTPAIDLATNLDANVDVFALDRGLTIDGSILAGRTVRVGRALAAQAPVVIGSGGLQGQIILNAENIDGTWSGSVTVGSTTLSPTPYYTQLSSQLGGGAVGLAPYNCHVQDCDPPHLSVLTEEEVGEGLSSVVVRHYGPVNFASGFPFVVMETELPNYVDVPNSICWECCGVGTCSYSPPVPGCLGTPVNISSSLSAVQSETNPRDIIVSGVGGFKFSQWHTYCFKPLRTATSNKLYCEGVTGSPVVTDYIYRFAIIGSMFDLNYSGDVEYGDVTEWFEEPVDFNGDEAADSADLAELIEAVGE